MVSIDPNKSIVNIADRKTVEDRSTTHKGEFDEIFRQTIDSRPIESPETESAHYVTDIRPIQFDAEASPTTDMVVNRVQRLIDTMAAYQHKLIENGATLKDIQLLVEKMASQNESLSAITEAVGNQERLGTIVNQSLMLSSMEIAKYNNGHYNDR